ncbi:MAG: hypothetical protein ABEL76_15795 [Bradymonadaceae bacterium]
MGNIKDEFMKAAMKALENPKVQEIMSNEKVQKGMAEAVKKSYELKSSISEKKEELADSLNLATSDDLRSMKRELDRLQRQVERLKEQQRRAERGGSEGDEDSGE